MPPTRIAYPRPHGTVLGQLGLSITATVAATLIVSGLQREIFTFRSLAPVAELTSGGKFAARVEALRAGDDDVAAAMPTPPRVPLLAFDTMLRAVPIGLAGDGDRPADAKPATESSKSAKRLAHAEPRRRPAADVAVTVVPPRRTDNLVAVAETVAPPADPSIVQGAWTTTKGLYRETVSFGGTVLDRVNPLNLLP